MKIRKAIREDIPAISALCIKTYLDAFGHLFTPAEIEEKLKMRSVEFYESIFDRDLILLAEEENKMVGYVQFGDTTFTPEEVEGLLKQDQEIMRLYVLSDYQGKGIGKSLLDAALADPKLKDAKSIYLDVWEENLGAQKLYKSYGFEEVGKLDEDIIMVLKNKLEM